MHTPSRRTLLQAAALAALPSAPAFAQAPAYPSRSIRMLLPFAAAGGPDAIARLLAVQMGQQLGQSVLIDNKPGGNSILAADLVAKAPADGYTLLYTTGSHTTNPSIYKKLPFDALRDFAPVSLVRTTSGFVMVINPALPYRTVPEFIAAAKIGKVAFGSPGVGNSLHLPGELLNLMAGTKMLHVPYKGASLALNAVISGEVQATFLSVTAALPTIQGGQVRALAVTSKERLPALPNVPTFAEAGVPGYLFAGGWQGVLAPAATPPDIVARLSAEIRRALQAPDLRAKIIAEDATPVGNRPEEFARFLVDDMESVGKIIRAVGIQVE
jgi:tripartite-type tricarboxylate transporter receptor subunit TctC